MYLGDRPISSLYSTRTLIDCCQIRVHVTWQLVCIRIPRVESTVSKESKTGQEFKGAVKRTLKPHLGNLYGRAPPPWRRWPPWEPRRSCSCRLGSPAHLGAWLLGQARERGGTDQHVHLALVGHELCSSKSKPEIQKIVQESWTS